MARQEDEWRAGTRIDMGKGKYFLAAAEEGTGAIYGASGSVIQSNVTGFQRSDGENGGSVFSYTTDTGSQRTDRYDANGARLGSTNVFKTVGGNMGVTEIGAGQNGRIDVSSGGQTAWLPDSSGVRSTLTVRDAGGGLVFSNDRVTGTNHRTGARFSDMTDTTSQRQGDERRSAEAVAAEAKRAKDAMTPSDLLVSDGKGGYGLKRFDPANREVKPVESKASSTAPAANPTTVKPKASNFGVASQRHDLDVVFDKTDYKDGNVWRTKSGQTIGNDEQRKQYAQATAALKGTGAYYDHGVFRTKSGSKIGGDLETVKSWADTFAKTRGTGAYYSGGVWRTRTGARLRTEQPAAPTEQTQQTQQVAQAQQTQQAAQAQQTQQAAQAQPSLPNGVTRDRMGRLTRNGAILSATQLKAMGYQAAEKGGRAREDLDSLIADLDRYGPAERMSGEKELTADEVTEWEASRTRSRDAGLPVDDLRYRRDEESGKVYRRWSRFDLSDGERKLMGKDPDAEVAALRAMYDYAKLGGKGARDVRDIRSLAWNLRRNRALANGGR